jgi:hypothetical protein
MVSNFRSEQVALGCAQPERKMCRDLYDRGVGLDSPAVWARVNTTACLSVTRYAYQSTVR